ncbi:MAG: TrbG/VirB9 family P-type conjugative transfer protein, partial [Neisseriaceae bacterium]|nr:TrbG/VirB9 family P-type conjugative transfer protein [Neisseriaceae bacterium]
MYKFWIVTVLFFLFQSLVHSDDRIVTVNYHSNQIVEVYTSAGYATTIEFGNENISAVAIGDTSNWQASPFKNKLFIKPIENHASKELKSTNMTVVTDKRDYYFQIYLNSKKKPTFILKFNYDAPVRSKDIKEPNKSNVSSVSSKSQAVSKPPVTSSKPVAVSSKPTVSSSKQTTVNSKSVSPNKTSTPQNFK